MDKIRSSLRINQTYSVFFADIFYDDLSSNIVVAGGCFTTPFQLNTPLEKVDNFTFSVVDGCFTFTFSYLKIKLVKDVISRLSVIQSRIQDPKIAGVLETDRAATKKILSTKY